MLRNPLARRENLASDLMIPSTGLLRGARGHAPEAKRKRNSLDIISEVLELAKSGPRKTTIMYKVNLSYSLLGNYLNFMLDSELLEKSPDQRFFVTRKGREALRELGEFTQLRHNYLQKAEQMQRFIISKTQREKPLARGDDTSVHADGQGSDQS